MNERIRELIKQATVEVPLYYGAAGLGHTKKFDKEKFAELIIQECVSVCKRQRDPANLNYKPSERFAEAIKLHFR